LFSMLKREKKMNKISACIRVAIVVLVIGLLAQLSAGEYASWAAPGQDVERQTLPTFTPTSGAVTDTPVPPPTNTPAPSQPSNTPVHPSETLTPTPGAAPTVTPAQAVRLTVISGTLVYDGPGFDYDVVGSLQEGDYVVVVGRNAASSWWQIVFQDGLAWVPGEALDVIPAAHEVPVFSAPPAGAAQQTPAALPESGGGSLWLGGGALLIASGALALLAGGLARRKSGARIDADNSSC
jgi:hypothetical protein